MLNYSGARFFQVGRHLVGQADEYRIKAAALRAKATRERDVSLRVEWENLAIAYVRLAKQAEKNQQLDITYEPPPPKVDGQG